MLFIQDLVVLSLWIRAHSLESRSTARNSASNIISSGTYRSSQRIVSTLHALESDRLLLRQGRNRPTTMQ